MKLFEQKVLSTYLKRQKEQRRQAITSCMAPPNYSPEPRPENEENYQKNTISKSIESSSSSDNRTLRASSPSKPLGRATVVNNPPIPTILRTTRPSGRVVVVLDPPGALLDIVFCHALTRSWRDTWNDTQTQRPWPETFLPGDSTPARILVYDADPIRLWSELSERAMMGYSKKLLEELAQIRQRTTTVERPISWVGHSLGGLVVECALGDSALTHRNASLQKIVDKSVGIALFSTPHCGIFPEWDSPLDKIQQCIALTSDGASPTFGDVQRALFIVIQSRLKALLTKRKAAGNEIHVITFHERRAVDGIGQVVPEEFAKILEAPIRGISGNHMDICKCGGLGFEMVLTELSTWIPRSLRNNATTTEPRTMTSQASEPVTMAADSKNIATLGQHLSRQSMKKCSKEQSFNSSSSDTTDVSASNSDSEDCSPSSMSRPRHSGRRTVDEGKGALPNRFRYLYTDSKDIWNIRDNRNHRDMRDTRDLRGLRENMDIGGMRDIGYRRDFRERRELRDMDFRGMRDSGEERFMREIRDVDIGYRRDFRERREIRGMDFRGMRDSREERAIREIRDMDIRGMRDGMEERVMREIMMRDMRRMEDARDIATSPEPYRYHPLSQPRTIRLLKLDTSDSSSSTTACQLLTVPLDTAPPFFALSYCWGTGDRDKSIICKSTSGGRDQELLVTVTLAQALQRLRHLSSVTSTLHRGGRHVGSINMFGQQLTLSELKSGISRGFHSPRCRARLHELAEELPLGSEEADVVVGYIRYMETLGHRGSRFDMLDDLDPTRPRRCTVEELFLVLDRLIRIEESDKERADADTEDTWDLSSKYFWIDQICIDQSNKEEQSSQVKLMGSIYSKSIRTLIWIGEGDGDGHLAFNLAEKIANLAGRHELSGGLLPSAPMTIRRHGQTGLPPFDRPEWPALSRLLSADWFNRIWVIQEAILSQRDSLVLYGHSVHSWTRLRKAASWLFDNAYEGLTISGIPPQLMNIDTFTQLQTDGTEWRLLAILDQTYNGFRATKQKDKIYGVLGLCAETKGSQWPAALEPTYREEYAPWMAFRDVARYLIQSTKSLTVLSFVCVGGQRDDIPSWVPDFTGSPFYRGMMNQIVLEDDGKTIALRIKGAYRASLGLPLKLETHSDPNILALRGVRLDTVAFQLEENFMASWAMQNISSAERSRSSREIRKQIDGQVERFTAMDRLGAPPTTSNIMASGGLLPSLLRVWTSMVDFSGPIELWKFQELAMAFHRIVTAGQSVNGIPFTSEEEELQCFRNCSAYMSKTIQAHFPGSSTHYKDLWETNSPDGNADEFFAIAGKWCSGRRFFRTANGRMGMGPGTMKEGDFLCLLFGSAVPYILRPKGRRDLFIGDCYVDDLMEGQGLRGLIDRKLFVAFDGGSPYLLRPNDSGPYSFDDECDVTRLLEGQEVRGIAGEQIFEIV